MPFLTVKEQGASPKIVEITGKALTIGRSPVNNLVLKDTSVSRLHARIVEKDGKYLLEDLESDAGTKLNGQVVDYERLKEGDTIAICSAVIVFSFVEPEEPTDAKGEMAPAEPESPAAEDEEHTPIEEEAGPGPAKRLGVLEVFLSGERLRSSDLYDLSVTIGREDGADLVLPHPTVSGRHARIFFEKGRFHIEDLRSSNGTFVNGNRITSLELPQGARISMGEFELHFRQEGVAQAAKDFESTPVDAFDDENTGVGEIPDEDAICDKVVVVSETNHGREFPLRKPVMVIGRDATCDIVLPDESVSRSHAVIIREKEGTRVEDQDSLNGTKVNKKNASDVPALRHNDLIKVGNIYLQFVQKGRVYALRDPDELEDKPQTKKANPLRAMLFALIAIMVLGIGGMLVWQNLTPSGTVGPIPTARKNGAGHELIALKRKVKEALTEHRWLDAQTLAKQYIDKDALDSEVLEYQAYANFEHESETLYANARAKLDQGENSQAIEILKGIPAKSIYWSSAQKEITNAKAGIAQKYMEQGDSLLDEKKLAEAMKAFKMVLEFDPENQDAKDKLVAADKKLNAPTPIPIRTGPNKGQIAKEALAAAEAAYLVGNPGKAAQEWGSVLQVGLPNTDAMVKTAARLSPLASEVARLLEQADKSKSAGDQDGAYQAAYRLLLKDRQMGLSGSPIKAQWLDATAQYYEDLGKTLSANGKIPAAYEAWDKALTLDSGRSEASAEQEKIMKKVRELMRLAVIDQDTRPQYAVEQCQTVMQMLPPSHEDYGKAKRLIESIQTKPAGM